MRMPAYVHAWVYAFRGKGKKKKSIQSMKGRAKEKALGHKGIEQGCSKN